MKQSIITIIVIAVLGYGYYELRNLRLGFSFERGETRTVRRGDLTIPISATGKVGPDAWYEVKSKASGEVIEINYKPGEPVEQGDLLIQLDRSDEQRMVDRTQADVTRTKATLDQAKIKKRRLESVGLRKAQALVDQLTARLDRAEFQYNKIKELDKMGQASAEELVTVKSSYDDLKAQLAAARAELDDIEVQIETAEKDIVLAQAAHDQAASALGDAEERLQETDIHAPVDGMVVKINTQVGAVIQGGQTTFTGGTILAVIADMSRIYVRTEVDEADIGTVRDLAPEWAKPGNEARDVENIPVDTGTPVRIRVDSFHGEEFTGVIERIHPEPNSTVSGIVTYQVDVLLTSENQDKLLSGMQADVEFTAQSALDVVLVPHEAIKRDEFGEVGVYVPVVDPESDQPKKKFVACRFGLDNGMFAEVLEGVEEGTKVYTKLPQRIGDDDD
jgi:RND family efflux transporter MFP subunit